MAIIVGLTASMAWAMGISSAYYISAGNSLSESFAYEELF
jgi:hypothetical protein